MTTPDNKPETPQETPETAPKPMTFLKLHDGLADSCSCKDQDGAEENIAGEFVRRLKDFPPVDGDFESKYEQKKPRQGDTCKDECSYRGVSIFSVDEKNEEILKRELADNVRNKPKLPRIYCKFRLKPNAGLIWPTPRNLGIYVFHCDLLKCDEFCLDKLEIIEICSLV